MTSSLQVRGLYKGSGSLLGSKMEPGSSELYRTRRRLVGPPRMSPPSSKVVSIDDDNDVVDDGLKCSTLKSLSPDT